MVREVLAAAVLSALSAPVAAADCTMTSTDRAWLEQALDQWDRVQATELHMPDPGRPTVHAVDAACTYILPGGSFESMTARAHPAGEVELPSAGKVPLGPISFAFDRDGFAMSLPSVWRAAGVTSELGLEQLMTGVLLHEIAHTRQADMIATIEPAAKAAGVAQQLSDDLLQERFEAVPGYEAAVREEIAVLFAAAASPDEAGARGLAAHALHMMRQRHARWLAGDKAHFAAFDDVFLTMEGTGQWLVYRYLRSPEGGAHSAEVSLSETRRGGKWWSQDGGLALFLVLDRLLPDWRIRAFRERDWLATDLLTAAVTAKDTPS